MITMGLVLVVVTGVLLVCGLAAIVYAAYWESK